jgi:hypothetical protein
VDDGDGAAGFVMLVLGKVPPTLTLPRYRRGGDQSCSSIHRVPFLR